MSASRMSILSIFTAQSLTVTQHQLPDNQHKGTQGTKLTPFETDPRYGICSVPLETQGQLEAQTLYLQNEDKKI